MTTDAAVPQYIVEEFERALDNLKRKSRDMREAIQRAERGPGYEGRPPQPDTADATRLRRAPAIELMWKKGAIDDGQFLAAQRYWMDRETSTIAPTQVARYEALAEPQTRRSRDDPKPDPLSATTPKGAKRVPGAVVPLSDLKLDALGRINRVHDRILKGTDGELVGLGEAGRRQVLEIVDLVVVKDMAVATIGRTRRHGNKNAVMKKLRAALEVMARHYGTNAGSSGEGRIRVA